MMDLRRLDFIELQRLKKLRSLENRHGPNIGNRLSDYRGVSRVLTESGSEAGLAIIKSTKFRHEYSDVDFVLLTLKLFKEASHAWPGCVTILHPCLVFP